MTHPQTLERNLEHTPALNEHSTGLRLLQPYLRRAHARGAKRWARAVEKCVTIDHLRQVMEKRVPPIVREYYRGGADNEITLRDNVEAFQRERFKPRSAVQLDTVEMRTEILGHPIALPVIAAPIGSPRMLWPRGEAVAAKAVGEAGTICTLSTLTGTDLEEVSAASPGPCWYQLYLVGGKDVAARSIERAKNAGYSALVLTIDTAVSGNRAQHEWLGASQAINGTPFQKLKFGPQMIPLSLLAAEFLRGRRDDAVPQCHSGRRPAHALRGRWGATAHVGGHLGASALDSGNLGDG